MARTVVTGSNGLLGSALRRLDPPNTVFLTREEVDLTDFSAVNTAMKLLRPERVIHTAAVVGGLGGNMVHSGEYFRNNIMLNTNVLEAARQAGVQKLISFMSTCVFPDRCEHPLKPESLHSGPPHPSNFGYAYAKRMLEVQSSAYRKEWNCNFIVAVPANVYGPHDNFSLSEGHVVPALIHKVYAAKQNGTELLVWGSGQPLREFIYVDDIARLSLWALDHYHEEAPLILSSGIETRIADLVSLVAQAMQFEGRVRFDASKPDGQYRKPSDITKLREYRPDFLFTPVAEGIKTTVQWFVANYPEVRR